MKRTLIIVALLLAQSATDQINSAIDLLNKAKASLGGPSAPLYLSITDRTVRVEPALPTLGNAGSTYIDAAFGNKVLRVTDQLMDGTSWRVPSNAHLAAWNADSTKFFVVGNAGVQVFAFDNTAFAAKLIATPYSQTEPAFSRIDADALYTIGGSNTRTIRKYSVSKATFTDVVNLDTLDSTLANPRTYIGALQTAADAQESIAVLYGGQGQDQHHLVLWRQADGFSETIDSQAKCACNLHSISMDMSGRFVTLYPTNAKPFQVMVWDVIANTVLPVMQLPAGHDTLGYGVWVNMDCCTASTWDSTQWQFRSLDALTALRELISPVLPVKEQYLADHTSWNNAKPNVLLPVISSTYRFQGDVKAPIAPWRAWDNEILGVATTGPSTVWRFAHHRSDVRDEANPIVPYFWYEPIANVSPDGGKVIFTSNMGKSLGADPGDPGHARQDVFLVQLR